MNNKATSQNDPGPEQGSTVLVAISGGPSSILAAALLKNQGFNVIGVHMDMSRPVVAGKERFTTRCNRKVPDGKIDEIEEKLDFKIHRMDRNDEFENYVADYFVHEFIGHRTPVPCVECNKWVLFDALEEMANEKNIPYFATGHSAQIIREPRTNQYQLLTSVDPERDQTYFLFRLEPKILPRLLLPLGGIAAEGLNRLGAQLDLKLSSSEGLQSVCAINNADYYKFIDERTAPELRETGVVRSSKGTLMGEHYGLHRYRVGQTGGLTLTGVQKNEVYYVTRFDTHHNSIVVGGPEDLVSPDLNATRVNWLLPVNAMKSFECTAKIRPNAPALPVRVTIYENHIVHVEFAKPCPLVQPGYPIVFYQGNLVLGGGMIDDFSQQVEI